MEVNVPSCKTKKGTFRARIMHDLGEKKIDGVQVKWIPSLQAHICSNELDI